ncbi:MAG: NAD(P)-dependent oxidoreductase [Planctomycetota bacterium]
MNEVILLTGGSGKIGGKVLEMLLAKKHRVRALIHKNRPAIEHENLETVQGSLLEPATLREAVRGCSRICHLAAAFDLFPPARYEADDEFQWKANLEGTFHLVQAARKLEGLKVFLFASTDATYATGSRKFDRIITEDTELVAGRFYGLMKVMGEVMLEHYRKLYGFPYTVVRFCWTLSEDDALKIYEYETWEGSLVPEDKERLRPLCAGGRDLLCPVYADGSSVMDHVADADDIAQGVVKALFAPKAVGGTFNLAGPGPFKHTEVVKVASEGLGVPYHKGVVKGVYPYKISIAKAKRVFGYAPRFSVADTIRKAVAKRL